MVEWNSGMTFFTINEEFERVEGVGRGQTCMLHMHAYDSSAFSKRGTCQVRPLSTAQWHSSVDSLPISPTGKQSLFVW